jgi:hypothetical protein
MFTATELTGIFTLKMASIGPWMLAGLLALVVLLFLYHLRVIYQQRSIKAPAVMSYLPWIGYSHHCEILIVLMLVLGLLPDLEPRVLRVMSCSSGLSFITNPRAFFESHRDELGDTFTIYLFGVRML